MLAVLISVALPLFGFAWFARTEVTQKRADDVVRIHLRGTAAVLAGQLQAELFERHQDVDLLGSVPSLSLFMENGNAFEAEFEGPDSLPSDGDRSVFRGWVEELFNDQMDISGVYDRILALDREGSVVGWNTRVGDLGLTEGEILDMESQFYGNEDWFAECLETGHAVIDFHRSEFAPKEGPGSQIFHVAFAARIKSKADPDPPGVVVAFMNWRHVQNMVNRYGVRRLSSDSEGPQQDIYQSSYAWIWGADANTIQAHQKPNLYGTKVSDLEGGNLMPLVEIARESDFGMFPKYIFEGEWKQAAFHHLDDKKGLNWVVGVGVNQEDIYAGVRELNRLFAMVALLTLTLAGGLAWLLARRLTRPVLLLKEQAERVAAGDLQARVRVVGRDEMAELSLAFNSMAHDLAENRDRLIRAEKEAAWREMALQVAHEIKNPLTPIQLSVGLLRRIWNERREEFEPMLHSTLDMIERQVGAMREVTRDFSAFAGTHKPAQWVAAGPLLAHALQLTEAWSAELGVRVDSKGLECETPIYVHPGEMQRALINLVNNALEAMPEGGVLTASVGEIDDWVEFRVCDTGAGISEEAREHLFEPHFTTRNSGTGLGLAIVRRVVESRGGTITLLDAKPGPGAEAVLRLPCSVPDGNPEGTTSNGQEPNQQAGDGQKGSEQ